MAEKNLTVGKVLERRRKSTQDTLQRSASLRYDANAPFRERGGASPVPVVDDTQEYWIENVAKIKESLQPEFDKLNKRLDGHDERFDSVDERFDSVDKRFDSIDKSLGVIRKHLGV
jgi:hypothetical protein